MIKIGVLSDTHGHLDPKILEFFQGVDHIFHAGDIGLPWLILQLEGIAPVTAVQGNSDHGLDFKELEIVCLDNRKFMIHHIVQPEAPAEKLRRRIIRENPDVVIFGHTHKQCCQTIGQTLYFNPGYSGEPKSNYERSVAVLQCDDTGITAEFKAL
jgi:putative phosphoesterase